MADSGPPCNVAEHEICGCRVGAHSGKGKPARRTTVGLPRFGVAAASGVLADVDVDPARQQFGPGQAMGTGRLGGGGRCFGFLVGDAVGGASSCSNRSGAGQRVRRPAPENSEEHFRSSLVSILLLWSRQSSPARSHPGPHPLSSERVHMDHLHPLGYHHCGHWGRRTRCRPGYRPLNSGRVLLPLNRPQWPYSKTLERSPTIGTGPRFSSSHPPGY